MESEILTKFFKICNFIYFLLLLFCVLFFLFFGSEVWTQSLVLAKQTPYHLNQASNPFCFSSFSIMIHVLPGPSWARIILFMPLNKLGWYVCTTIPHLMVGIGLPNFFSELASNYDPPDLHLPLFRLELQALVTMSYFILLCLFKIYIDF
jgi:hypothetical protein